ncbi:hypothetical protein PIB30_074217 [Stylosanthes scabra]|uniref:Uncharacterized protein n=1 Tax=Stylosanthes scabra TaxID=79078 RepID=A0ABU6XNJ2_9FABA|nr:hypothetical protein [Stylosanthes scabra]
MVRTKGAPSTKRKSGKKKEVHKGLPSAKATCADDMGDKSSTSEPDPTHDETEELDRIIGTGQSETVRGGNVSTGQDLGCKFVLVCLTTIHSMHQTMQVIDLLRSLKGVFDDK